MTSRSIEAYILEIKRVYVGFMVSGVGRKMHILPSLLLLERSGTLAAVL